MSSDIIMLDIFIPKLVNDLLSIARFPTKKILKKNRYVLNRSQKLGKD